MGVTQGASKMARADPVVTGGWAGTRMIQALQGVEVGGDEKASDTDIRRGSLI